MDTLKHTLEAVFSPVGVMVALLLGGVVISAISTQRRLAGRLLTAGAVLFLLYYFSPISEILILRLERENPPMLSPPRGITKILVLSGYGEDHPGFPVTSNLTEETVMSLSEGLRLYNLIPGAELMVSGGVLRLGDRPVARMMADYLTQLGIPERSIVVEGNSRTTYENFVETKKIIGSEPFILVANASAMPRALGVARKFAMKPYPAPAGFWASQHYPPESPYSLSILIRRFGHPSWDRLSRLERAYHEHVGYAWYRLLGRL